MELNKDMAEFTADRDVRVVAEDGTMCVIFEEGETKAIHRKLWPAAVAAGLVPEAPENLEKKDTEKPPEQPKQSKEELVAAGLLVAIKEMIVRGDPKDFTVVGLPRTAAVKKLVDFDFTAQEVQRAFELAVHEVGQDGDDGKERSESDSNTAE